MWLGLRSRHVDSVSDRRRLDTGGFWRLQRLYTDYDKSGYGRVDPDFCFHSYSGLYADKRKYKNIRGRAGKKHNS